jgi:phosphinothricin acetyltransferase
VSDFNLRTATEADAPQIQAIYAPVVEDTVISFEVEAPTVAEMARRITATTATLPWLVAEGERSGVVGYAYAAKHRERAAYRWSVDVSVYVEEHHRGQGIGRRLYQCLFANLADLGYVMAFAGITLPNPASVGLHEAVGFVPLGVFSLVGYKHGRWHDVGWWQRALREAPPEPETPRSWSP